KGINWVTPALRKLGNKAEILFQAPAELLAYDVTNGQKAWSFKTESPTVPTTVVVGDLILVPGKGLICLKPKADGSGVEEVWRSPKLGSGTCTPVVYQDRVYNINSAGSLVSGDLKTGKEIWQER